MYLAKCSLRIIKIWFYCIENRVRFIKANLLQILTKDEDFSTEIIFDLKLSVEVHHLRMRKILIGVSVVDFVIIIFWAMKS